MAMKHTTSKATKRKQQATVNNSKFISAASRSRKQQQCQFLVSPHKNPSPLSTLTLITELEPNILCLRIPLTLANWNVQTHIQLPTLKIRRTFLPLWSQCQNTLPFAFNPLYALCSVNNKILPYTIFHSHHTTQQIQINLRSPLSILSISTVTSSRLQLPSTTNL